MPTNVFAHSHSGEAWVHVWGVSLWQAGRWTHVIDPEGGAHRSGCSCMCTQLRGDIQLLDDIVHVVSLSQKGLLWVCRDSCCSPIFHSANVDLASNMQICAQDKGGHSWWHFWICIANLKCSECLALCTRIEKFTCEVKGEWECC
jgi:hypothetical protein